MNHRCCSGVLLGKNQRQKSGKVSSGQPHFAPEVWINTVKRWHANLQGEKTRCPFKGSGERRGQVNCSRADTVYQHLPFNCCLLYILFTPWAWCVFFFFARTWCLTIAYEKWYSFFVPLAFSLLFLKECNVYELLHGTQCQRPAAALLLFDVWYIQSCN